MSNVDFSPTTSEISVSRIDTQDSTSTARSASIPNLHIAGANVPTLAWSLVTTTLFYLALIYGPVDSPWLKRYCLCHPVAVVTVGLFTLSVLTLLRKLRIASTQRHATTEGEASLAKLHLLVSDIDVVKRVEWWAMHWNSQSTQVCRSWLGVRIARLLDLQTVRGHSHQLEADLKFLSEEASDKQYESYGVVRTSTWAMPMLGFLGTVLGISATLGTMDMESLASGSQESLNKMTSGLYVAFDTTAIALALTMVTIFFQSLVNRVEQRVLGGVDQLMATYAVRWLAAADHPPASTADELVKRLAERLGKVVSTVVTQQADLWKSTIDEARKYWSESTAHATIEANRALVESINGALDRHARYQEKVEAQGAAQIEARWQQWQITLSEQTRALQSSQAQLQRQGQLLCDLLEKNGALQQLEQSLDNNLYRLTDIDRFHEAAICLTEAVAFLGTQLERQGLLGKPAASVKAFPAEEVRRRRAA